MSQLLDRTGKPLHSSLYRKADPPKIGEQFAPGWASLGKPSYHTPGGRVLLFYLDRLTLQDFRAMRSHYQINISLSLLSFMIHQVNWRIEGTDTKVRRFVQENMREIWGRFIRATSSAYWAGYAPVILQYENDGPNEPHQDQQVQGSRTRERHHQLETGRRIRAARPYPAQDQRLRRHQHASAVR